MPSRRVNTPAGSTAHPSAFGTSRRHARYRESEINSTAPGNGHFRGDCMRCNPAARNVLNRPIQDRDVLHSALRFSIQPIASMQSFFRNNHRLWFYPSPASPVRTALFCAGFAHGCSIIAQLLVPVFSRPQRARRASNGLPSRPFRRPFAVARPFEGLIRSRPPAAAPRAQAHDKGMSSALVGATQPNAHRCPPAVQKGIYFAHDSGRWRQAVGDGACLGGDCPAAGCTDRFRATHEHEER